MSVILIMDEKIGILTTENSPLMGMLFKKLVSDKFFNFEVIFDKKNFSEKDKSIWKARTGGQLGNICLDVEDLKKHNIPKHYFDSHNDEDCIEHIKKANYKFILNCGTPRKLNFNFLQASKINVVNIHPGIIPEYRGSCCVEWAILNNDPVGNTSHFMTEEYDTGPILFVEKYNLKFAKSYQDVRIYIYKKSIKLMTKTIYYLMKNNILELNLKHPKGGKIYSAIPDHKLRKVLEKIETGI